jgi:hypothetical protein
VRPIFLSFRICASILTDDADDDYLKLISGSNADLANTGEYD